MLLWQKQCQVGVEVGEGTACILQYTAACTKLALLWQKHSQHMVEVGEGSLACSVQAEAGSVSWRTGKCGTLFGQGSNWVIRRMSLHRSSCLAVRS